jgi:NCS1 family nucleobase:cation symporter-1
MMIAGVGAILITWFIVAKGPTSIKFFNMVISPALVLLMGVMLYLILSKHSFGELGDAGAEPPFEDKTLNFAIAVEVNLAAGFSWWPYIGNLARLTKNERTAFWPNILGIFGAAALGEIVGLLAAVALGESDPTIWMTKIAGVSVGVIALLSSPSRT